jgi:hypothetical protein
VSIGGEEPMKGKSMLKSTRWTWFSLPVPLGKQKSNTMYKNAPNLGRLAINISLLKQDIIAVRMGGKRQKGVENKVLCNTLSRLNLFAVN